MTTPEDAIRARRRLTNKFIAAHDAGRLTPFLDPQIKVIVGDGSLILGAPALIEAFAAQFHDPDFVTYVRTPAEVIQCLRHRPPPSQAAKMSANCSCFCRAALLSI